MQKLTVLYTGPTNPEGFESHYEQHHLPLVRTWPRLRAVRTSRFSGDASGNPPPVSMIVEILFDDVESLEFALMSEPLRSWSRDLAGMAEKFGVTAQMLVGTEDEIA